ncbi:hypothetical protein G6F53_014117 [Rhizopus delemar]|nr:hypothetical protein G6F53_014117 [Rhizopus delemar]
MLLPTALPNANSGWPTANARTLTASSGNEVVTPSSSRPAVRITARSAKIGPTILPTVRPTPNALSTNGTTDGDTCVTAPSVSARYV